MKNFKLYYYIYYYTIVTVMFARSIMKLKPNSTFKGQMVNALSLFESNLVFVFSSHISKSCPKAKSQSIYLK